MASVQQDRVVEIVLHDAPFHPVITADGGPAWSSVPAVGQQQPVQMSPDGRAWWDGVTWRPVP
ncbi:hypothetical protein [Kineosporia succinea]|uniref:Uncharacterized protein n=1 Tax=Kineosporia succinea TaxID=84632 RepID=A0ABT9PC70_9ACTN|nr:hypothetical protein [Kineosporia succinea]MDP9830087.1 hypothetical protein [Kineosporia succinea]